MKKLPSRVRLIFDQVNGNEPTWWGFVYVAYGNAMAETLNGHKKPESSGRRAHEKTAKP